MQLTPFLFSSLFAIIVMCFHKNQLCSSKNEIVGRSKQPIYKPFSKTIRSPSVLIHHDEEPVEDAFSLTFDPIRCFPATLAVQAFDCSDRRKRLLFSYKMSSFRLHWFTSQRVLHDTHEGPLMLLAVVRQNRGQQQVAREPALAHQLEHPPWHFFLH